ncbi:hypothetical protein QOT38_30775, partial [Pseudomonas aeruginosa]
MRADWVAGWRGIRSLNTGITRQTYWKDDMRFIIKLAATVVAGTLLAGCGGEDFTGSYRAKNPSNSKVELVLNIHGCGFHAIRPPSPLSSGQAFHGHLA